MHTPPCILSIAGADSGGGAGIQADLKTMTVLGAYGMSVTTALTAQNGLDVAGIHPVPPDFVSLQIRTVRDGFPVAAAKTGMLFSEPIIEAVAEALADRDFPLVVDPVCVSQTGRRLLQEEAVEAMRRRMLPLADLLTPNIPEAELLADLPIRSAADVAEAGRRLLDMGARAALIKGGHFVDPSVADAGETMTDWLCLPGQESLPLAQPRVHTANNHGTGCTLSAAVATWLGLGAPLAEAVVRAQRYLNLCLREAYAPGKGVGPVNHAAPFFHLYPLGI
jgi:hydroxymethylpyrimidine/phosphomethylpyrimidine kinase